MMLELLDTGRMAAKCGKWRGLVIAAWSLVPAAFSFAMVALEGVLLKFMAAAGIDQIPALGWGALGSAGLAQLILIWAAWQLYRDHAHGDYYVDAENYRAQGW